jgi:hypothetical protein
MRFIAVLALAAVAGGCAVNAAGARVALTIQGASAGAPERQRCVDAARRAGAIIDLTAPVKAYVTLEPTGTRLQVLSPSRGLVRDEAKPAGTVEALCHDAALAAASAPETSPQSGGPPFGQPPPTPVTSPTASGGAYHGPISQ